MTIVTIEKDSSKPKVLVTGASGFVGKALCQTLMENHYYVKALVRTLPNTMPTVPLWNEVLACDLEKIILTEDNNPSNEDTGNTFDTFDNETLGFLDENPFVFSRDCEIVFHLAGIAHASKTDLISETRYMTVNYHATQALLQAAHKTAVKRFVYVSSVKANSDPNDHYAYSKFKAEEYILEYGLKQGIEVVVVRPSLVYGPGVKGNLEALMMSIKKGSFPPLPHYPNKRSLVSLTDLVQAIILCGTHPNASGQIYTVTDDKIYTTWQLVDAIRNAYGLSPVRFAIPASLYWFGAKIGDLLQWLHLPAPFNSEIYNKLFGDAYYSSLLIEKELGFKPRYDFYSVVGEMTEATEPKTTKEVQ